MENLFTVVYKEPGKTCEVRRLTNITGEDALTYILNHWAGEGYEVVHLEGVKGVDVACGSKLLNLPPNVGNLVGTAVFFGVDKNGDSKSLSESQVIAVQAWCAAG